MKFYNNPRIFKYPVLVNEKDQAAQVRVFETYPAYQAWVSENTALAWAQVPANRIAIVYAGSFDGGKVKPHPNLKRELEGLLKGMADYYLKHVLKENKQFNI
jgi:hypothetical protein